MTPASEAYQPPVSAVRRTRPLVWIIAIAIGLTMTGVGISAWRIRNAVKDDWSSTRRRPPIIRPNPEAYGNVQVEAELPPSQ